jgi:hypothetical protein
MSNSLLTINQITTEALDVLEDNLMLNNHYFLDSHILRVQNDTRKVSGALLLMMNMKQEELALNNVWRLEITKSGSYKLNDFTMPSNDVIINKMHRKKNVPKWMLESLAVLQILDDGESITDVGKKIDNSIFYLLEPRE